MSYDPKCVVTREVIEMVSPFHELWNWSSRFVASGTRRPGRVGVCAPPYYRQGQTGRRGGPGAGVSGTESALEGYHLEGAAPAGIHAVCGRVTCTRHRKHDVLVEAALMLNPLIA